MTCSSRTMLDQRAVSFLLSFTTGKASHGAAHQRNGCRIMYLTGRSGYSTRLWPSTGSGYVPKPSLDIKHIRSNPGLYEQNCIDRNYKSKSKNSWTILDLFKRLQDVQKSSSILREQSKVIQRELAQKPSDDKLDQSGHENKRPDSDRLELIHEGKRLKAELLLCDGPEKDLQKQINELAYELPNLSSEHTPPGNDPRLVEQFESSAGRQLQVDTPEVQSHIQIGSELGIIDFDGAITCSGWGWYFLVGDGALLEQALIQYALSVGAKRGWKAVSPPSVVYSHIATACGFQPRDTNGEQQIYALEQLERDKLKRPLVLTGTAEISFAGMYANRTFNRSELPLKIIGPSRCYRAEAGARGASSKGLYRVHEFTKVEMFAWTLPDEERSPRRGAPSEWTQHSTTVFEEMIDIQEEILQGLNIPYKVLEMAAHDLGASASRKRDIEAYFPSREKLNGGWGEVTSASVCTDYQSRRLDTKVRDGQQGAHVYTVNGTALAVPRVLAAVLEHGWDSSRKAVAIPKVLRPWMGDKEYIERE